MFEIGFWEVVLIAIIALLVVGPQRLPEVARTAGLWLGKMRALARSVKSDIDQQLAAEELKAVLKKQADLPALYDMIDEPKPARTLPEASPSAAEPSADRLPARDTHS